MEHEASKIGVKAFVSGNQFIRKGQAWHQASFFKPKDGCKWSRKKDALYSGEGNNSFCIRCTINPIQSPCCFFLYCRNSFDSVEKVFFFCWICKNIKNILISFLSKHDIIVLSSLRFNFLAYLWYKCLSKGNTFHCECFQSLSEIHKSIWLRVPKSKLCIFWKSKNFESRKPLIH